MELGVVRNEVNSKILVSHYWLANYNTRRYFDADHRFEASIRAVDLSRTSQIPRTTVHLDSQVGITTSSVQFKYVVDAEMRLGKHAYLQDVKDV